MTAAYAGRPPVSQREAKSMGLKVIYHSDMHASVAVGYQTRGAAT